MTPSRQQQRRAAFLAAWRGVREDFGRVGRPRAQWRGIAANDARVSWRDRPRRAREAEAEALLRGLLTQPAAEVQS